MEVGQRPAAKLLKRQLYVKEYSCFPWPNFKGSSSTGNFPTIFRLQVKPCKRKRL